MTLTITTFEVEEVDWPALAHVLLCFPAQQFGTLLNSQTAKPSVDDLTGILDCLIDGIDWLRDAISELEVTVKAPRTDEVISGLIGLRRAGESLKVTHHLLRTSNSALLAASRCGRNGHASRQDGSGVEAAAPAQV
ncbi:hypothetical protein [Actinomadura sp. SCN-SB]|uniref:hypothetical protein n=1 Tax=Actinomadura sp. SCN-SB TaxID=3373092 RepID=UPI003750114B